MTKSAANNMADDITGINISELCFEGPMKDLTATINLQPAVTTINLALLSVLTKVNIIFRFLAHGTVDVFVGWFCGWTQV